MKQKNIVEKDLSYELGGIFFEIQRELGRFCRERQYADAFEKKLIERNIAFKREYPMPIADRKSNFVDFLVEDRVFIDIKAKPFIEKDDFYQMKRYLDIGNKELGLIVNFRDRYLKPKRVLCKQGVFVDSDAFVVLDRSKAFTLVELIISMALFVILIAVAAGGFVSALRTQRSIASLVDANNNASLALEQIAREIRTGYDFCGVVGVNCEDKSKSYSGIRFTNAGGKPVEYTLEDDGVSRGVDAGAGMIFQKITAESVSISALRFTLMSPGGKKAPHRITINFTVASRNPALKNIVTNVQTTVSGRNF